jgi:hypothetical protein
MAEHEQPALLPYRPVRLAELEEAAAGHPAGLPDLLAAKFNYDVKQGGFAQLLYNLQGNFLPEMEEMLTAAGARLARDYYVRAVKICLGNKAEYFRFLSSDYTDTNPTKEALQLLSVEYLMKRIDFIDEAGAFLETCPRP